MAIILDSLSPIDLPEKFANCSSFSKGNLVVEQSWDESSLKGRAWIGTPHRSVILYLHGIEGHGQWFEYTASELNKLGLTIYAIDRRGSGLNLESRGHLHSYRTYLKDVEHMLRQLDSKHPKQPIILFANCWSAKAAALIAKSSYVYHDGKKPVPLSGLIMTNPALATKVDFGVSTKLAIALAVLRGGNHSWQTWPIPLTTEMLTSNPIFQDFLRRDPLRLKNATANFYAETFKLGVLSYFSAPAIDLPTLIIQSEKDAIVDVRFVRNWFSRLSSAEKKFLTLSEATHSLDFDQQVFHDYVLALSAWIEERELNKSASQMT
jgi:acylglycerol lipase